jgi:TRAP transporter 4TM/12TM fusion protein
MGTAGTSVRFFRDRGKHAMALPEDSPLSTDGTPQPAGTDVRARTIFYLGIVVSLLHIYFNIIAVLPTLWQNALHYAGFALLCCLAYPLGGRKSKAGWLVFIDLLMGLAAALSAVYLISMEDAIYARGVRLSQAEWAAGIILILTALEFTRRTTGIIIPILIVLALSYVSWWGGMLSGVFKFTGLTLETILFRSVYGDDGIFGNIARISSTFVFMFILFGAFLLRSGAGEFVINLARAVAGKTVGGPGLVAVFASGLTGTISGSAVANTASTGVITIPLMKKAGFDGKFAAGVESAASTGGQLMPPIMGAGAFVMASYTQIPYTTIVAVSFLPALLYFASVAFYVRIEAQRSGVQIMEDEGLRVIDVLKEGGLPFLIPIGALIGMLIYGFTPTYAAGISIVAVIVSSWLTPNKMGVKAILEALALGAKNMIMTGVLLCAVGLIVNVIATTGIGNTFSMMITEWSSGNLLIAITLIALASLVLGMGLPVTAAYIVLGTLSAPALYNLIVDAQLVELISRGVLSEEAKAIFMLALPEKAMLLGQAMPLEEASSLLGAIPVDLADTFREVAVSPDAAMYATLSAHLIIFWLSQDSNVTPPVCLAAFTAAAIAKTPPMLTGFYSWKLAKGLYIVPLLFAYSPMLKGSWIDDLTVFLFALIGLYAFAGVFQGYLERKLYLPARICCVVLAFLLLAPVSLLTHSIAAVLFAALWTFNLRQAQEPRLRGGAAA